MDSECRLCLGIKQDFTSEEVEKVLDEALLNAQGRGGRRTRPGLRQVISRSEKMIAELRGRPEFVEEMENLSSDDQRRKMMLVAVGFFCYPYSSHDAV